MPRSGSGTYDLPAGNPVVTGTTISSTTHNTTSTDLAIALSDSLAKDGQTVPTANLPMGANKHTGVANATVRTEYPASGQIQDGTFQYIPTVGGTADAITLTISPAVTAYVAGQAFWFKAGATNTGAVTVNLNAIGVKSVTKFGTTALVAGDILINSAVVIRYDGVQFQLLDIPDSAFSAFARLASANIFTANQTIEKSSPRLDLNDTSGINQSSIRLFDNGVEIWNIILRGDSSNEFQIFETGATARLSIDVGGAGTYTGTLNVTGAITEAGQQVAKLGTAQTFTAANTFTAINTFTATQKWSKGADIASAAALTIGTDGNYFDVTGTTTVTSIATVGIGTWIKLHFDAALTLTHNATNLILPSGANITTAAGDEAEFVEYAAGNWRCTSYSKNNGKSIFQNDAFIFLSNDTYTPNYTGFIRVDIIGGGGGSGGGISATGAGGGGGGAGEHKIGFLSVTSGVPVTVTVGAGGTANNAGANTSIGTFVALGGGGGTGGGSGGTGGLNGGIIQNAIVGGAGGLISAGSASNHGGAGGASRGGGGGAAPFMTDESLAPNGASTNQTGNPATANTGCGAGGAGGGSGGPNPAGAAGGSGVAMIFEIRP